MIHKVELHQDMKLSGQHFRMKWWAACSCGWRSPSFTAHKPASQAAKRHERRTDQ